MPTKQTVSSVPKVSFRMLLQSRKVYIVYHSGIKCSQIHPLEVTGQWTTWVCWVSASCTYLMFVIFFTRANFLENKIYTEKTRKLLQNTQKIANFLRYYSKIHSKLPIFRVKSVKIYTGQKKFTRTCLWGSWQISGMNCCCIVVFVYIKWSLFFL